MLELTAEIPPVVDTITADEVTLSATVTGAPAGATVRFVKNGESLAAVAVEGDPFVTTTVASAPTNGQDRWRAEVLMEGERRTITSHLWLQADPAEAPTTGGEASGEGTSSGTTSTGSSSSSETTGADAVDPPSASGCACDPKDRSPPSALLLLALLGLRRQRHRST